MANTDGRKRWAVSGCGGSLSFLNTCDHDAEVAITFYFPDREPKGPYTVRIPAKRCSAVPVEPWLGSPVARWWAVLESDDLEVVGTPGTAAESPDVLAENQPPMILFDL